MKKTTPQNNSANQQNANKGTNGTNKAYDKAQGNRGKQLNPKITNIILLFILVVLSNGCGNKNNITPDPCNCPPGNIKATSNDLLGKWRIIKRTFYDPTGTTVKQVEDFTALTPADNDAFVMNIYINENGRRTIELPVGAIIGNSYYGYDVVKIDFEISYYQNGGSCMQPAFFDGDTVIAIMDVCISEFTPNYIKMSHIWDTGHVLQEYEAVKE